MSGPRISPGVIMLAITAVATVPAFADVYPSSTTGRARSYALVFPNPFPNWDQQSYFGSTGDYEADGYQFSTIGSPPAVGATCEVTSSSVAHVDASGTTGTGTLHTRWVASNTMTSPNTQGGSFDSDNYFQYSFITDTPGTITINTTSSSNLPNVIPLDPQDVVNYAMAINHTVTFNGEYTELYLNDQKTLVYQIPPGFHVLLLERHPNSGLQPWPNCDVYSTSSVSFTIETEPTPPDIMGDMDCDGDLDIDDVPAMVDALLDPGLYQELYGCLYHGDFTFDEFVNGEDLQGFVDAYFGE